MADPIQIRYSDELVKQLICAHAMRNPNVPKGSYTATMALQLDPITHDIIGFLVTLTPGVYNAFR